MPSWLTPVWVGVLVWCGMLFLFTLTAAISNSESWMVSLNHTLTFWCLWLVFFPLLVLLSLRFPLERPNLGSQIILHVSFCLLVILTNQLANRTFLQPPPPPADFGRPAHLPPHRIGSGMRAIPDILLYLATMSACVAFAHYQRSQERERRAIELEASLAQAKLQTLRMQINPHFLFNTLNAISTLIHTAPQTADDMITDLSELFRASLENSDEHEVPLSRELEFLRRYLAIEQRRFGERLKIQQNIDPKILEARVPTLILQPLVENAIRHGIEPYAETGIIAIAAARDGDHLKLSVSDNGQEPFNAAIMTGARQGIGLANTQARLQQLYGDDQSFTVGDGELGGWTIEIKIPFVPPTVAPAAA